MKSRQGIRISFLGVGVMAVLLAGNTNAEVFPVATNPAVVEFAGGLAFDGTNYLVGYVSGTNLVGRSVSTNGQLLGSPIIVGANPGFPPAAAVADANVNCLVAWSDTSIGSGVTVFGQLMSPSSGLVGSAFPLLASAGSHGFQTLKAAASDGTDYLVVWQDNNDGSFYGQLVTDAGALSGAEFLLYTPSGSADVAAAFGSTNYLVAVQDGQNNVHHVYCRTVSPGGVAGGGFQVDGTASLDQNPLAIGFDGTNFLVVWNQDTSYGAGGWPNWNLQGRLVSPAGAALGSVLDLVTGEQALFPAVAFDGVNYLLAWGYDTDTTNLDMNIHARFLDRSGNVIGPVFTPFSTQGTYPPLLPVNGVLFDGNRFLLAATYGSFTLVGGQIVGFSGGDVYARLLDRSTLPPFFTNPAVVNGQATTLLHVVPGQTYTIETSTNLASWTPMGTLGSEDTNVLNLVDDRGVAGWSRLFYRAVVGNTIGATFNFSFHEFANAGGFGGGFTPTPSFPVSLNSYVAVFEAENEIAYPAVTNVVFTGPAGSGLANTPADPNNSWTDATQGYYQSPSVSSPSAAPGGAWVVNYKGTNINFSVPDPQAASRLVIPLPTVSVSGDVVQSVSWTYRDATTGTVLGGAPAYLTGIQVQIEGIVGGRVYDSPELDPSVTSHVLTSVVNWSNVQGLYMAYEDSLGNQYVVMFAKP